MSISIRNSNNYIIVDIHSTELNLTLVRVLRTTLRDLVINNKVNILINLSIVESIHSSALGCLISAQKKCTKRGGLIEIFGVQPDILMIFYVIQLDKYIGLYNNEFDALYKKNILVRRRFRVV